MKKKKVMCSSVSVDSGAGIGMVKIEELHDFKGHPFKVERNQELFELISKKSQLSSATWIMTSRSLR